MAIEIVKRTEQARGNFNGGEILENKPIGFPREGGKLSPYSNLFYWAHAWSEEGSTIGLHPHQGFEILSFVLEGSIDHYDTSDEVWKPIEKGGAQIIRAGNGISHSERLNEGAHMFQIWFDPHLDKTLAQDASYDDFTHADFPQEDKDGITIKTFKGEGAPILMDSPGVEIREFHIPKGDHEMKLDPEKIYSLYLIEGQIKLDSSLINPHDFLRIEGETNWSYKAERESKLFMVSNSIKLDYLTYAERTKAMMA